MIVHVKERKYEMKIEEKNPFEKRFQSLNRMLKLAIK